MDSSEEKEREKDPRFQTRKREWKMKGVCEICGKNTGEWQKTLCEEHQGWTR